MAAEKLRWLVHQAEKQLDAAKLAAKQHLHLFGPLNILPYVGMGYDRRLRLRGRLLEAKGLEEMPDEFNLWENLKTVYHRYESDEIPGARLRAAFRDQTQEITTDAEGYFRADFTLNAPLPADSRWQEVTLTLLESVAPTADGIVATGQVLSPGRARFGVISDIDDTVLISRAGNPFEKLKLLLMRNARTRKPFSGVAAFYRALQAGTEPDTFNPVVYVSSSEWNLYDLLQKFMAVNELPRGPLLLRDLGIDAQKFITSGHHDHKRKQIEDVLDLYHDLKFILVGDSGQQDPEIYQSVVEDYPGRVAAIYIRDVTTPERDAEVHRIAEAVASHGVPMQLVADTEAAVRHAAEQGFVAPEAVAAVAKDRARDEEAPEE